MTKKDPKPKFKKMKRHVIIAYDGCDLSEYDIQITQDIRGGINQGWNQQVQMTYGSDSGWMNHIKGTEAASLRDNGNGVKLKIGNKIVKLDYSEIAQIQALLLYYSNIGKLHNSTQIITFHKQIKTGNQT